MCALKTLDVSYMHPNPQLRTIINTLLRQDHRAKSLLLRQMHI
jgi:hypothetical protein